MSWDGIEALESVQSRAFFLCCPRTALTFELVVLGGGIIGVLLVIDWCRKSRGCFYMFFSVFHRKKNIKSVTKSEVRIMVFYCFGASGQFWNWTSNLFYGSFRELNAFYTDILRFFLQNSHGYSSTKTCHIYIINVKKAENSNMKWRKQLQRQANYRTSLLTCKKVQAAVVIRK